MKQKSNPIKKQGNPSNINNQLQTLSQKSHNETLRENQKILFNFLILVFSTKIYFRLLNVLIM